MALLLPQYGLAYWMNRDFDLRKGIQAVKAAIPGDGLPIVGNCNEWYAFNDRPFITGVTGPACEISG